MFPVRGLLTRDAICRKTRNWPLLSAAEMQTILTSTSGIRSNSSDFFLQLQKQFLTARCQYDPADLEGSWSEIEQGAFDLLSEWFPYSLDLLKHFEGRIIAAGGAVFKSILKRFMPNDIDFFFVDPEVERLSPGAARAKYDDWLAEAITFLTNKWLTGKHPDQERTEWDENQTPIVSNVYILRSEFVTTVHLISSSGKDFKYQFIHRVYPSIGAILGGFDLGPAMIATDGHKIMATELGAYSVFGHVLIVDTSRRSTTFENRLKKYAKDCHLILPGLPASLPAREGAERPDVSKVWSKLEEVMKSVGYDVKFDEITRKRNNDEEIVRHILNSARLEPIEKRKTKEKMLGRLKRTASKYGFTIENPQDIILTTPRPAMILEDVINQLQEAANSRGYRLNMDSFVGTLAIKKADTKFIHDIYGMMLGRPIYDDRHIRPDLTIKRFICKLPHVHINLESFSPDFADEAEYAGVWVVSATKGRKYVDHTSDYQDNVVWPSRCVSTNLTMLAAHNLSAVVSVLILKPAGTDIMTPYGNTKDSQRDGWLVSENVRLLGRLEECALDFTPDEQTGTTKQMILSSFVSPQFGDVLGEIPVEGKQGKRIDDLVSKTNSGACPPLFIPEIIGRRLKEAKEKLTGINWRLTNPGTQWTSSYNPVIKHPKDWYGERYVSFRIGCEEVEMCLRLMRLRDCVWKTLPRDVFGLVVREVVWINSYIEK